MLGAVIGDIVGSRFEADNHKSKEFDLFTQNSCPTDDSIMTLAVAKALLASKEDWGQKMLSSICRKSAVIIPIVVMEVTFPLDFF